MNPKKPNVDMGSEIHKCLDEKKRSVTWLANEIGYDPSSLNKQLMKEHFRPILLFQISQQLEFDFFALYSKELAEIIRKRTI